MSNVLVKCVKVFWSFSESTIFNQKKKCNLVIQRFIDTKGGLRSYMLPVPKMQRTRVPTFDVILEQIHNVTKSKTITQHNLENIVNLIESADYWSHVLCESNALLLLESCNKIMDCGPLQRIMWGEYVWNTLLLFNVKLNTDHCNELLHIYVKNDHDFSPADILIKMKKKCIQPNYITYQQCIEYYCKRGNVSQALELLGHMQKLKLPINEVVYSHLITGYSHVGSHLVLGNYTVGEMLNLAIILNNDINAAIETRANMEMNKIRPSAETYTALMCLYAKINDVDKIKEIIQDSSANNINLSNRSILNVIYVLVTNNHKENIDTMLRYINNMSSVSNDELLFILKFISLHEANIVVNIVSHIFPNQEYNSDNAKAVKFILKSTVENSMSTDDIINLCDTIQMGKLYEKPLLTVLYHSFFRKSDNIDLPLLRACQVHYPIKPHYFWPMLVKKAAQYDFNGILGILQSMVNEFNVMPCVKTISEYVVPCTFGNLEINHGLLRECNIDEAIIDHGYVLSLLRAYKMTRAVHYMLLHRRSYSYKILGKDLINAFIHKRDVESFVSISNLITSPNDTSIEGHLINFQSYFPHEIRLLQMVLNYLRQKKVTLKPPTEKQLLHKFIHYRETL